MAKRKPGRPREAHKVPMAFLHVEIPRDLKRQIKDLAKRNDRKMTAEVLRALREYLVRSEPQEPKPSSDKP